jgi:RNA polymerase sigma factor (sigma-70 family)
MSSAEKRARQREVDKFFDDHQSELLGFLLNMGLSLDDAEDVLDESFLAIWRYWDKLRGSNPRAYLYRVARNQSFGLGRARARRREDPLDDSVTDGAVDPAIISVDFTQQVVDRETMRWALQKLTVREREAVLLRYYVGCNLAETATVMGVKTGTVKGHAAKGLKKLYRVLNGGNSAAARKEGSR